MTNYIFEIILTFILSFFAVSQPLDLDHQSVTTLVINPTSTPIPTPTLKPQIIKKIPTPFPTDTPDPWGVARQVGEHTWTMKIGQDSTMATPAEILSALNEYRRRYGSQILTLDSKLVAYAQSRADYFFQRKNIDSHVGFNNFLEKEDGFNKLGYTYLGENISYGYQLNGVHLIEWIYAGDEPHNKNQLDSKWDHVGIGVRGTATCLIFATGKM